MGRLLAIVIVCSSCATSVHPPFRDRLAIAKEYQGRVVELRASSYYGDLYDENERWMLSPYAFHTVHHIVDAQGKPIRPTGQRGIVPAGTRFRIMNIEFPTVTALAKRMLTTPRYNPWVTLHLVEGQDDVPRALADRDVIVLLPMDLADRSTAEAALAQVLAPEGEVRNWLGQRRPTVQAAIKHKRAIEGMNPEEAAAALGLPRQWLDDELQGKTVRVAWFGEGNSEAWFAGDALIRLEDARPLSPESQPSP